MGVVGGCMWCMACVLDAKGWMPVALKICPKYWISLGKKLHLLIFMERLADQSFLNTFLMCERCSWGVLLNIIISSRYAIVKLKSFRMPVICSLKYPGACANPNGALTYLYFPKGELKAVLVLKVYPVVCGGNLLKGLML